MLKKLMGIFLIVGVIFSAHQLLAPIFLPLQLFIVGLLILSLKKYPERLLAAALAGLLLDLAYFSFGFHLLVFLALTEIVSRVAENVSLNHFVSRVFLAVAGTGLALVLSYFLVFIFRLLGAAGAVFWISLSWPQVLFYLILNSLLVLIILAFLRKGATAGSYEKFS